MSERNWMPLYWGDYLRDTRHLNLKQHGAYLLLIGHYWTHGCLPKNDTEMAQVLGIAPKHLPSIWLAIAPFFEKDRSHKRIEKELEKHRVISEKRAMAGRKGGLISRGSNNLERFVTANLPQANAKQTGGIPQPHIDSYTSDSEIGPPQGTTNGHSVHPQPTRSLATALPTGALARGSSSQTNSKLKPLAVSPQLEAAIKARGWDYD